LIVLERRSPFGSLLGGAVPLMPFMAAVALSAWAGGMMPGLVATGLGALGGYVLLASADWQITGPNGPVRLVVFVVVGGLVSRLFEALHAARRQADAARERQARADEERREAERSLRESEQWLELALEAANLGQWELDLVDRTARRTLRHDRIFGYESLLPEWTYELFLAHVLPEDRPGVDAQIGRSIATGKAGDMECRIRRADGLVRWIWLRGRIEIDDRGQPRRMLGTVADITERRLGEDLRREQNERLRLLWESAGVMLVTDDPDAMLRGLFEKIGRHFGLDCYFCFLANEAGDALRLVSCAGVPGVSAAAFPPLPFGEAVCGVVASRGRPMVVERVQESDDPMIRLIKEFGIDAYVCNPLRIGDRLLGTLSFGSRTRGRFDEAELEFLQTICHYVTVAYERLRLIGQLREADRRKDEFLATLAHELRNPLAPIRSSLEILRIAADDREIGEQARATMERQLKQMIRLIDDLLDVSRITRGKLTLRMEPIELEAAVRLAVEIGCPLVEASGHQLHVALPAEPVPLDADLTRLAQVFSNLLSNACKYTGRGGRIDLTAEREGDEVVVRVADTGIGIPADKRSRIFEMFEQLDRSLDRAQGGLGIGLTLAKRLIELHGGTIAAASDGPGLGSEFVVRLPVRA
jgi:PAS domain S-box-containing protein